MYLGTPYSFVAMVENRKQHWLPAAYLKFFSIAPTERQRQSLTYRLDQTTCRQVSVDSQCFGKYFYSKDKPNETEKSFQDMENDYPQIVEQLEKSKLSLSEHPKKYFGLIYIIIDFHLRNVSYRNNRKTENIEAFAFRRQNFWHQEITAWLQARRSCISSNFSMNPALKIPTLPSLPLSSEAGTKDFARNLFAFTRNVWRFQRVECEQEHYFTSDNPSIWFQHNGVTAAFVIPLTPRILGVAYDQRQIKMRSGRATIRDIAILNSFQVIQCCKCVYSAFPLADTDAEVLPRLFSQNRGFQKARGFVDDRQWGLETLPVYFPNNKGDIETFSFWELCN
jgi:hypothetical protein